MKLSTDIKPRTDGTVRVLGEDGQTYVFQGEALECDIEHEPTLTRLLKLGTFFPATEADHEAALALVGDEEGDEDGDDEGDEPVDPNAPPVETGVTATPAAAPAEAATPAAAPAAEPTRRTRKAS